MVGLQKLWERWKWFGLGFIGLFLTAWWAICYDAYQFSDICSGSPTARPAACSEDLNVARGDFSLSADLPGDVIERMAEVDSVQRGLSSPDLTPTPAHETAMLPTCLQIAIGLALIIGMLGITRNFHWLREEREGIVGTIFYYLLLVGLMSLSIWLSVVFRNTYTPVVTFLALSATFFAVEHLGSLGESQCLIHDSGVEVKATSENLARVSKDSQGILEELKKAKGQISTLLNRFGMKDWTDQFKLFLESPAPVTCVISTWDDLPSLGSYVEAYNDRKLAYADFLRLDEQPSFYRMVRTKYDARPDVKTTFISRCAFDPNNYLYPAAPHDDLNAYMAMLAILQMRMVNEEQRQEAVEFRKWLSDAYKNDVLDDTAKNVLLNTPMDNGTPWKVRVVERVRTSFPKYPDPEITLETREKEDKRLIATYHVGDRRFSICVASTRAYHVLTYMSLSIPWLTLVGSPDGPRIQELPDFEGSNPWSFTSLEQAFAVAFVADEEAFGEGKKSKGGFGIELRYSTTELQRTTDDYAFDLIASPQNPAFERRINPFKDPPDAEPTRVSLRTYDRNLRSETRHGVPLEIHLASRMLWRLAFRRKRAPDSGDMFACCFPEFDRNLRSSKGWREALQQPFREFLDEQRKIGELKNGARRGANPKDVSEKERTLELLWRQL